MKPSDTAKKFNPQQNNHVIFVRKNKFYEVPVVVDGQALSMKELESYGKLLSSSVVADKFRLY